MSRCNDVAAKTEAAETFVHARTKIVDFYHFFDTRAATTIRLLLLLFLSLQQLPLRMLLMSPQHPHHADI